MRLTGLLFTALTVAACDSAFGIHAKGEPENVAEDAGAQAADADALHDADRSSEGAASVDAAVVGTRPPPRPAAGAGGVETSLAFAARHYYFGARDPMTGAPDPSAWRRIGFDVDGVDTTEALALADSPGTCRRGADSPPDVLLDGDEGRDNNFGAIIRAAGRLVLAPESLEVGAQDGVKGGTPTPFIVVEGLSEGPDDDEVTVGLMVTANTTLVPWEELTFLPVDGRSLVPGTTQAKLRFDRAYMTANVVVAGGIHEPPPAPFVFPFDRDTRPVTTNPLGFVITLELDPGHTRVVASTVASVMTLADVVRMFTPPTVRWGLIPCTPEGQQDLYDLMKRFADLRSDRPQFLDPTGETQCDVVSMAIQVGWHPVRMPELADVRDFPPGVDDCAY